MVNAKKPNGVSQGQWMAFCRDAENGVSPGSLAQVYSKSLPTVSRWLKRLGIKEQPATSGPDAGGTGKEEGNES